MLFKENSILVKSDNYKIYGVKESEEGYEWLPLRNLITILDQDEMDRVLLAFQEDRWDRRTRYCGSCGAPTKLNREERCKICPNCDERFYQALYPAVIVSIVRDDKILLAHNKNFPGEMHSVIAGFVDLGESLESAVRREVKEEVGLEVGNISYFGSQNWGFTSSLMVAFKAEYKSGEICVDGHEIDFADWFDRDHLPEIPPKISIARALIDEFVK